LTAILTADTELLTGFITDITRSIRPFPGSANDVES